LAALPRIDAPAVEGNRSIEAVPPPEHRASREEMRRKIANRHLLFHLRGRFTGCFCFGSAPDPAVFGAPPFGPFPPGGGRQGSCSTFLGRVGVGPLILRWNRHARVGLLLRDIDADASQLLEEGTIPELTLHEQLFAFCEVAECCDTAEELLKDLQLDRRLVVR